VTDSYETLAVDYDWLFDDNALANGAAINHPATKRLLQRIARTSAVLDAACGTGINAAALARRGFTVRAADASIEPDGTGDPVILPERDVPIFEDLAGVLRVAYFVLDGDLEASLLLVDHLWLQRTMPRHRDRLARILALGRCAARRFQRCGEQNVTSG
jgi:SAM-dependent methyltransferase